MRTNELLCSIWWIVFWFSGLGKKRNRFHKTHFMFLFKIRPRRIGMRRDPRMFVAHMAFALVFLSCSVLLWACPSIPGTPCAMVGQCQILGGGHTNGTCARSVVGQGSVPLNFSQWTVIPLPSRAHWWFAFVFLVPSMLPPCSNTLAQKIPWMEEPGGLQSMGSRRVRHDWATSLSLLTFMHWKRKWQPTPVFLPGESQGRGSLVGCHLWCRTESDTTEVT